MYLAYHANRDRSGSVIRYLIGRTHASSDPSLTDTVGVACPCPGAGPGRGGEGSRGRAPVGFQNKPPYRARTPPRYGRAIYQIMSITCKRTCTGTSGCHGKKL